MICHEQHPILNFFSCCLQTRKRYHLLKAAFAFALLFGGLTLTAQQPIKLAGKPVLSITEPNGFAWIQVIYNKIPLPMRLTLKLPNGDTLPCRWRVTEANSDISMPDKKGNIVVLTPKFPGQGGKLDFHFYVSFPEGKYLYPVPVKEGLPIRDNLGKVIEENVKWELLNPRGKAFIEIDRIMFLCIQSPN
jgi:hypothetical protein